MFDIGVPELLLVSLVALLIIGPDRLPETVRTIMLWLGRLRRSFSNIKREIEQEIGADEIRQQLYNESVMKELDESRQYIEDAIDKTDNTISEIKHSTDPIINPSSETKPKSDDTKRSESGG